MADERPTGITVLAVLDFIVGVLTVLGGIWMLAYGGAVNSAGAQYGYSPMTGAFAVAGVSGIIMGLIAIAIGYGLWTGKSWAWWLTLIFSAIGVLSILMLNIVNAVISAVILWYILKPHVQEYFGVDFQYKT